MALTVKRVVTGVLEENCWVLYAPDRDDCVVIDPGDDSPKILQRTAGRKICAILLTHGHFDHIGAAEALMTPGCELIVHEADATMLRLPELNASWMIGRVVIAPKPTRTVRDGDVLEYGGMTFTVLHTPGHTAGSCCFLVERYLFTGDTVMSGGFGRTDLPTGSEADLRKSIARLGPLLRQYIPHGGHGV